MASLACSLAPLASWISLILLPALPMTEPMRELGMMKLSSTTEFQFTSKLSECSTDRMVTAREPGTEGTSNGSSLILRTTRPKACTSNRTGEKVVAGRHDDEA